MGSFAAFCDISTAKVNILLPNKQYYSVSLCSDVAHQQADWNSIHEKVCELLSSIRTPAPFSCFQADSDIHHMQTLKRLVHRYNSLCSDCNLYIHQQSVPSVSL